MVVLDAIPFQVEMQWLQLSQGKLADKAQPAFGQLPGKIGPFKIHNLVISE